ncbi:hypothetical protein BJ138DRAFT_1082877 [Hygrophoropsis aurantiaca]|uniref:Uncharacterized protein n=1 Tax=Hygrophoropsis aurantiaca TaxID=72124 RepID=A0ACB8AI18_9AGAM|nr:hypothetical protein BJ138DRAFT_1082877 [Hygrophoropsis aurantiaca]
MSGFAALMALSASQTKETQSAVQTALQQRQRNEEIKRKKREETDRKEKEEQAKLRQKRFEDEKKQQELEARRLANLEKLELEKARREEEQRNALLYGPKRAKSTSKWPQPNGRSREEVRRTRLPSEDGGSRSGSPGLALTREEKRQRKLEADMRRTYQLKRSHSSGYSKAGRRLPGGAIDSTAAPNSSANDGSQSVKARLTALPNTLTKLNVNKRDTRTIDEILQDRAKAREGAILDGDDAKEFNDWFGKKKDTTKTATATAASRESSGADSPISSGSSELNAIPGGKFTSSSSSAAKVVKPAAVAVPKASSNFSRASVDVKSRPTTDSRSSGPKHSMPINKTSAPSQKAQLSKSVNSTGGARLTAQPKKRPRSESFSPSPPPSKRRAPHESQSSLGAEIWKIFGKDRNSYVQNDILSDDEDMEADATALEREEMRRLVYRQAKKEDMQALEEEKRHEEEKRRRKRERERR